MNFEHLIAINDPGNPLLMPLSRDQLWAGLQHRVENPLPFLPGLEACTLLEQGSDYLLRELDFGAARIRDRVTMQAGKWVCFEIEAGETHAGGCLTITIEEPEPGYLFLRFAYVTSFAATASAEDQAYVEYIKSAYQQSDLDCVRIIRTLAAEGLPQ